MGLMLPFYKAVSDLMVMYLMLPFYKAVSDLMVMDLMSPLYKAMSDLMVFYRVVMDLMLPFYKAVSDLMVMYLMLPLYKAVVDLSKDWLWLSIMSGSGFGEILFEISPSSWSMTVWGRLSASMSSTKQSAPESSKLSRRQARTFLIRIDLERSGIMILANL